MAAELLLTKIYEISVKEGTSEDAERDWLPVTSLGVNDRRVTVRLPYPMGDFDKNYVQDENGYHLDCPPGSECDNCGGTGSVDGAVCPVCHGTGSTGVEAGAITVSPDGIVSLRIEDASLGITADGKLFARSKIVDKGGLAVNENDQIYVSVDDETIAVNDDGQLYVKEKPKFLRTRRESGQTVSAGQLIVQVPSVETPDNVSKVKVHIALDLIPKNYGLDSTSMSLFTIKVGSDESDVYTWDHTVPYTIINYTTVVDIPTSGYLDITMNVHSPDTDAFPVGMSFNSTVTVMEV